MNKEIMKQMRDCPEALYDYYLDHGKSILKEFNRIGLGSKILANKTVTEITIKDIHQFLNNIEGLKLFPIQKVTYKTYLGKHWEKKDKYCVYYYEILDVINKLKGEKIGYAVLYNTQEEGLEDLSRVLLEILYDDS